MIDVALGKRLPFKQNQIRPNRWALEVRVNAEDPKNFSPSFGPITRLLVPMGPNVRVASGVYEGGDIPPWRRQALRPARWAACTSIADSASGNATP